MIPISVLRWVQRGKMVSLIGWGPQSVTITHHCTQMYTGKTVWMNWPRVRLVSELSQKYPTLLLDVEMRHLYDSGGWTGVFESSVDDFKNSLKLEDPTNFTVVHTSDGAATTHYWHDIDEHTFPKGKVHSTNPFM